MYIDGFGIVSNRVCVMPLLNCGREAAGIKSGSSPTPFRKSMKLHWSFIR